MKEVFKKLKITLGGGTLLFLWACSMLTGPAGIIIFAHAVFDSDIMLGVYSAGCLWWFCATVIFMIILDTERKEREKRKP